MIRVQRQPEPPEFDARVRKPGQEAVTQGRDPLPSYWTRCLPQLYKAYDGICAYSCFWIPPVVGVDSVEHFAAKSTARNDAYEWDNYRLVSLLMNARKSNYADVLDPFEIGDDWFELEFAFFQVRSAEYLGDDTTAAIDATIKRLGLNEKDCSGYREKLFDLWHSGDISTGVMREQAPFVYREAVRQGRVP